MCFLLDMVLSSGEELSLTQSKAAHAEPSLLSAHKKRHFCIRSLLHKLWEGKVSWEPAAWGPQLHTQALLFLFPSLSLSSHTTVAHKAHSTFTEEKFSCLWFNRSSIFSRKSLFGLWSLLLSSLRVYLRKGWEILPFHCNPVCTNHVQDLTLLKATAALVSDFTWPLFHI